MGWELLPRREEHRAALVALLESVRDHDGYPHATTDLEAFLFPPTMRRAWVATAGGALVGHVGLASTALPGVIDRAATSLDLLPARCVVVARLFSAPSQRGRGIGRALLDHAAQEAAAEGLVAVLDTAVDNQAGLALYRGAGWVEHGELATTLPSGADFQAVVFSAPNAVTALG